MLFGKKCNHKTCENCGHLFENSGKTVRVQEGVIAMRRWKREYCDSCSPQYDRVITFCGDETFFKEIEVDSEGTPIGYKKIK